VLKRADKQADRATNCNVFDADHPNMSLQWREDAKEYHRKCGEPCLSGHEHVEVLGQIQDADVAIEARYIVTGFKHLPTNEALSNVAEGLDRAVCLALLKAGHSVQEEKFIRPTAPRPETTLNDDTVRVLIHIFRTRRLEDRDVGAMARALNLERGVLEYHPDRLADAELAETAGGNYLHGHVYWALTPKGRQHVVERTQGSV
jgi:hypothetical protein